VIAEASFSKLAAEAVQWMELNPAVVDLFEKFALERSRAGRRFGMRHVAERVRWETAIETTGSPYKIRNDFVKYIGHEIVRRNPELAQFVRFRRMRIDDAE
jgi:hypothetical protein